MIFYLRDKYDLIGFKMVDFSLLRESYQHNNYYKIFVVFCSKTIKFDILSNSKKKIDQNRGQKSSKNELIRNVKISIID